MTLANIRAGAKTRLSSMICGLLIFLYLLFAWPLIAKIPLAVIAAIIIFLGWNLIDKQSWKDLFSTNKSLHKNFYFDLSITTVVMRTTVLFNLIVAIGLGIAIAIIIFLQQVSKSCIHSHFTIDNIHSRVRRSPELLNLLIKEGKQGEIFQLTGYLFFASGAYLTQEIEKIMHEVKYIILDMRHIVYCDITGVKVLQRLFILTQKQQKKLLFTYLEQQDSILHLMQTLGVYEEFRPYIFENNDYAIEWVEEKILSSYSFEPVDHNEILLRSGLTRSLSPQQIPKPNGKKDGFRGFVKKGQSFDFEDESSFS